MNQGKCVAERDPDGGWMLMCPDGTVKWFATKRDTERAAKCWFRTHANADAVNVGRIEWRS